MITNEENTKLGLTVDEAREMLCIGRNLMLKLVKVKGFHLGFLSTPSIIELRANVTLAS